MFVEDGFEVGDAALYVMPVVRIGDTWRVGECIYGGVLHSLKSHLSDNLTRKPNAAVRLVLFDGIRNLRCIKSLAVK